MKKAIVIVGMLVAFLMQSCLVVREHRDYDRDEWHGGWHHDRDDWHHGGDWDHDHR